MSSALSSLSVHRLNCKNAKKIKKITATPYSHQGAPSGLAETASRANTTPVHRRFSNSADTTTNIALISHLTVACNDGVYGCKQQQRSQLALLLLRARRGDRECPVRLRDFHYRASLPFKILNDLIYVAGGNIRKLEFD